MLTIIILMLISSIMGIILLNFIFNYLDLNHKEKDTTHITQIANDNATQIAIVINNEESKKNINIESDDYE